MKKIYKLMNKVNTSFNAELKFENMVELKFRNFVTLLVIIGGKTSFF